MKNKKGVTEPTLIIGVLIIAATIFILGTTRVLVPLIKTQEEFQANDLAATLRTTLAAPENLTVNHKIDISGYLVYVTFYDNKINFDDYRGTGSTNVEFTGDTSMTKTFRNKFTNIPGALAYYKFSADTAKQFIFSKTYAKQKNKLVVDCKGCEHG